MKKILAFLLCAALIFSSAACGAPVQPGHSSDAGRGGSRESWAVYWYLCGSDLESRYACGTDDILELLDVELPGNVTFVIETGGASYWQNDTVDPNKIERYEYSSEGFKKVETLPQANMGKTETLRDFLSFCKENYPADHTMMLFWNHGGGSAAGAAFDENYGYDSLTLDEMHKAFAGVYELSEKNPPFEVVGFDTCLMATVDTAGMLKDVARAMVASQETEGAAGWYYDYWVSELAENTDISALELGKIICDSYYRGCRRDGISDKATLSVTDLSKIGPLMEAYEAFGEEALMASYIDSSFMSRFAQCAMSTENYGGNTKTQGYSNMADLGHMARLSMGLLASAEDMYNALCDCVYFSVKGRGRQEATGLSFYYPYSKDPEVFGKYTEVSAGEAFNYLYEYQINGELDKEGKAFLEGLGSKPVEPDPIASLYSMGWENKSLSIDKDGCAVLNLGPEATDILEGVYFSFFYVDYEEDLMMELGRDNDISADWEKGVFTDNFRGVWGAVEDIPVYMDLSCDGDYYNIYSVPILLNGEDCNMEVVYDFNEEEWTILGARKAIDENGMADKNFVLFEEGDEITILWMVSASVEEEFEAYEVYTFTWDEEVEFTEAELPDGTYVMLMELDAPNGDWVYAAPVEFILEKGDITTKVY